LFSQFIYDVICYAVGPLRLFLRQVNEPLLLGHVELSVHELEELLKVARRNFGVDFVRNGCNDHVISKPEKSCILVGFSLLYLYGLRSLGPFVAIFLLHRYLFCKVLFGFIFDSGYDSGFVQGVKSIERGKMMQFGAHLNIHPLGASCLSLLHFTRDGVQLKWKVYM
jgi:hypothetical protein